MKAKKLISALLSAFVSIGSLLSYSFTEAGADYSRVSVHDPSIVKLEEGGYFIIGSHLGAARSNDMKNWQSAANSHLGSTQTTFFRNIYTDLAIPEKWSNTTNGYNLAGNMWAPDIIYNKIVNIDIIRAALKIDKYVSPILGIADLQIRNRLPAISVEICKIFIMLLTGGVGVLKADSHAGVPLSHCGAAYKIGNSRFTLVIEAE